jgi:hypothetical protein
MVRDASRRKAKYEAKVDGDVARTRILALKSMMVEQMEVASADLSTLEAEIKKVIEGQTTPIYGHSIPAYLNVGRELYARRKKFSGTTFDSEATIVLEKWASRGLLAWALTLIAQLFGVTYP